MLYVNTNFMGNQSSNKNKHFHFDVEKNFLVKLKRLMG